jgi:hypothetical protein
MEHLSFRPFCSNINTYMYELNVFVFLFISALLIIIEESDTQHETKCS